jgi:hypothetical protein
MTEAEKHQAGDQAYCPYQDQHSGAVLVEYRPDEHAAAEADKGVHGEYPADLAIAVFCQLVRVEVGVESGDAAQEAKGREESQPCAKNNRPGAPSAFWVCIDLDGAPSQARAEPGVVGQRGGDSGRCEHRGVVHGLSRLDAAQRW